MNIISDDLVTIKSQLYFMDNIITTPIDIEIASYPNFIKLIKNSINS